MKRERIDWPPKDKNDTHPFSEGQPGLVELKRFDGDRTLRGVERTKCCDCGLLHLFTFEVFRGLDKKFYLNSRAYRLTDTELISRKRRKPKK